MRSLGLLLLILGATAEELRIVKADPLLRPGLLFRCTVLYSGPDVGPCLVSAALLQGNRVLSRVDVPLDRSSQLGGAGATLALPLPLAAKPDGPVPRLAVTISGAGAGGSAERAVGTVDIARQILEGHYRHYQALLKKGDEPDPLAWLRLEQGAAFASAPITLGNLHGLDAVNTALAGLRGKTHALTRPGTTMLALRDPVDGSTQPFRLHLPKQPDQAPLALLLGNHVRAPSKERWPAATPSQIAALTMAGIAVIEAYPAGDSEWSDIAPHRALLALDAVLARRDLAVDGNRPLLIGIGSGAAGARRIAENDPGRWGAALLVEPRWKDGRYHPENLATLPLSVIGDPGPVTQRWLDRLRSAGGVPSLNPDGTMDARTAGILLAARATVLPATPRLLIRSTPGPAGPVLIEELAQWGTPAEVGWQGDPLHITTRGIARLRLLAPIGKALVDGSPYRAPGAAGEKPRKAWGQACGPLDAYASGPFVIVVGSGESAAAATTNADLAQRFLAAWVNHAQGAPAMVVDKDFKAGDWPGRNLVLIGNSRSNRALRDMVEDGLHLPLTWDARSLRGPGVEALRAEGRAIACCWPHPANDGRLLVVLDGAPAWRGEGLPLSGLPDLVIGPLPGGGTPLLSVTFACDWR